MSLILRGIHRRSQTLQKVAQKYSDETDSFSKGHRKGQFNPSHPSRDLYKVKIYIYNYKQASKQAHGASAQAGLKL